MQKRGLLLFLLVFMLGCSSDDVVDMGDIVDYDYILTLDDGSIIDTSSEELARQQGIFDSTKAYGPATETMGNNTLAAKVQQELIGMQPEQTKTIRLSPEEAFGQKTDEADITFTSSQIEGELKEKGQIYVSDEKGVRTPYYITGINGDEVRVSKNHPYAGLFVTHEITVRWIDAR